MKKNMRHWLRFILTVTVCGTLCTHIHTEECGENGINCIHIHTEECYDNTEITHPNGLGTGNPPA